MLRGQLNGKSSLPPGLKGLKEEHYLSPWRARTVEEGPPEEAMVGKQQLPEMVRQGGGEKYPSLSPSAL